MEAIKQTNSELHSRKGEKKNDQTEKPKNYMPL